jgi:uncharacterized protein (TIGR03067 family)
MSPTRRALLALTCCALLCEVLPAGQLAGVLPRFKDEPECDVPRTSKRPTGADSPVATELKLDGVWVVVSAQQGGEKLPEEVVKDVKLTFRDGKLSMDFLGETRQGTYQVHGSKGPVALDLTINGWAVKGIFVLRGNTLTLCASERGIPRPTTFAAPAGSEHILLVLRRTKP